MIQWRFYFEQGDLITEPQTEQEDAELLEKISEYPYEMLKLNTSKGSLFINLRRCRFITRDTTE